MIAEEPSLGMLSKAYVRKTKKNRIWIISFKLAIAFITSLLAAIVCAAAFSEECELEIIGRLQQMIHDIHGF